MWEQNDRDMKIAGEDFRAVGAETQTPAEDSAEDSARRLDAHRASGNLDRANRLGARLVEEATVEDGQTADSRVLTQCRVLATFAVETGLEELLPDALLAQAAQNRFYETLRQQKPDYLQDVQLFGDFSFYYLCLREGERSDEKIGQTFASLCGRPENGACIQMGIKVYRFVIDRLKTLVDEAAFVPVE